MYGINNKSIGIVCMYVTTSVAHKPEVRIDLLIFIQIVNNSYRFLVRMTIKFRITKEKEKEEDAI